MGLKKKSLDMLHECSTSYLAGNPGSEVCKDVKLSTEDWRGRRRNRRRKDTLVLVLDSTDGLDLGGVGVGAEFPVASVIASVPVTLHDVLITTISRILVAHPAGRKKQNQPISQKILQD